MLPYFYESPFFDSTSNNATITTQATYNSNLFYLIQTREAFEERLRTMQGLEYMVSQDPSDNGRVLENSRVWVIRKQNRRKRPGMDDEITPINSYFVVGENIYMAPFMGDILRSRMVRFGVSEPIANVANKEYIAFNCHFPYCIILCSFYASHVHTFYRTHLLSSYF